MSKKQLTLQLKAPLATVPASLDGYALELSGAGNTLTYTFDSRSEDTGIAVLLRRLDEAGIDFKELQSSQSSLEDIFVSLVRARP